MFRKSCIIKENSYFEEYAKCHHFDFILAKGKKKRDWLDRQHVSFDEKIHVYLSNQERNNASMRLLTYLDQYADTLFREKEIKELLNLCDYMLTKYIAEYDRTEKEIRKFANELKVLCLEALEQN
ncbi:hypothetical protein AB1282_18905 [Gottfriedia sp. S16(2024)]|uniref:hypothetical protein n=1 Tax=Gottfriedia sp. S16(2024) TaxID=3162883 RepID=UPI003D1E50AF